MAIQASAVTGAEPRFPISVTQTLVGLLLATMVLVVAFVVPLATCPNCGGKGKAYGAINDLWRDLHQLSAASYDMPDVPSDRCMEKGRLTLYERWECPWAR